MDKTLQTLDKSLSTLIEGTTEKGSKLIDFLYEQAPEVVSQLLLYHGVESAVKCVIGVIFVVGGPLFIYLAGKKCLWHFEEKGIDMFNFWFPMIMFSVITTVITQAFGWTMLNLVWLKIWIAPKVYLLEWIANLAN